MYSDYMYFFCATLYIRRGKSDLQRRGIGSKLVSSVSYARC